MASGLLRSGSAIRSFLLFLDKIFVSELSHDKQKLIERQQTTLLLILPKVNNHKGPQQE